RRMARELSQEAVLDFLWEAGGRAPNSALLRHFQRFLRDPALTEPQMRERREFFKSLVNSLATVRPATGPGTSKDIVLRRRYRDLLDEELPPSEPGPLRSRSPAPRSAEPLLSRSPRPPLAEPPLSRSLPLLSAPGVLPLSRSLQTLPASPSPSPPLSAIPEVLSPSESRSLQHLPTRASSSPPRGSWVMTLNGPAQPQAVLLLTHQRPPLPSGPAELPPARPTPSQSPPRSLQPPASQNLLPARDTPGPQGRDSKTTAPLTVFRSIRCQLALLEVQDVSPSLSDDGGWQPRTLPFRSSSRNMPSRVPSVPLGQREHAWLVAVSAGSWAQVRRLFLEEPELALQRDFMSGFTILHWLAKHGDGAGLQELAAAARQAGLALDVDARSGCGYTPLHLAAIHGHQLVIKVLVLQLGCQVQVRDSSGRRPWEYLGSSTSGEIWQLLEAP
ncbi:SWAHB protein, partial [Upupa epops]|nr:SWAHB protein [Upupa epops]